MLEDYATWGVFAYATWGVFAYATWGVFAYATWGVFAYAAAGTRKLNASPEIQAVLTFKIFLSHEYMYAYLYRPSCWSLLQLLTMASLLVGIRLNSRYVVYVCVEQSYVLFCIFV